MSDTLLAGCETVVRRTAASTVVSCVLVIDTTPPTGTFLYYADNTAMEYADSTAMEYA